MSHAALYYRGRDCVRQSGGGWGRGLGLGLCQPRRHTSLIPLPSLSCRCLYTVCAWVALHFPHRVAACGARARVGEHRDVRRGSARGREPPPKPDRVQVHGVQWRGKGGAGWRAAFLRIRASWFYAAPGYRTRQTAVRANLTPAVSRFGSGLYRYCISYNVRWAVRCMASACRAVSAVSCMARHRVTGLPLFRAHLHLPTELSPSSLVPAGPGRPPPRGTVTESSGCLHGMHTRDGEQPQDRDLPPVSKDPHTYRSGAFQSTTRYAPYLAALLAVGRASRSEMRLPY